MIHNNHGFENLPSSVFYFFVTLVMKDYLRNLEHIYMDHNDLSSLLAVGFLEEHPGVPDILDTCCSRVRHSEGILNRTRACTLRTEDLSKYRDK